MIVVPAGGSASLTYVYSVGYSVADVDQLALAAQDRFQPPSVVIGSPAGGTTASIASTTLSGIVSAGSGSSRSRSTGSWSRLLPMGHGALRSRSARE